jgi:hypothetical protein
MKLKKALFYGGILAPFFYLLNDIVGGIITPNYSYIINTVSDLTKAGSSYTLGSILLFISAIFSILFGLGIMINYKKSKLIFFGGLMLLIIGIFNIFTGTIFPQDPIGTESTFPGIMHLVLVGISLIFTFLILPFIGIGLYKEKQWKGFRDYSFISVIIMFTFGILSVIVVAKGIEVMGLLERIAVYTFQIWSVVLAGLLLKNKTNSLYIEDLVK